MFYKDAKIQNKIRLTIKSGKKSSYTLLYIRRQNGREVKRKRHGGKQLKNPFEKYVDFMG